MEISNKYGLVGWKNTNGSSNKSEQLILSLFKNLK